MLTPITDDDIAAIVALMNRAYRGGKAGWNTEAGYLAGSRTNGALLRADLRDKPDASFLKWVGDGGPIACVWLEPLRDDAWYLGSLTIDPAQQGRGLGGTVLAAAERHIAGRGGRRVRMMVIDIRDGLIAWYARRGYRATGETAPFPYGDDRFGTPLRDDLRFAWLEKALG